MSGIHLTPEDQERIKEKFAEFGREVRRVRVEPKHYWKELMLRMMVYTGIYFPHLDFQITKMPSAEDSAVVPFDLYYWKIGSGKTYSSTIELPKNLTIYLTHESELE
jgi:hypothetical protein